MFKRLLSRSSGGSSKGKGRGKPPGPIKKEEDQEIKKEEGPDVRTPATAPLRYDDEAEALQLQQSPRPSEEMEEEGDDGDGQQPLSSSSLDAQALYADNFLLRREQARQRNELAEKRYREAQISAALEDANEERARLEEQVVGFVTALHERDVEIRRLKEEKAETEEVLRAVAEYHADQEEQAAPGPAEEKKTAGRRRHRLHRLLVLTAPGVGLLLLLLLLAAAIPPVDHRLLGGLGGLLLLPSSPLWQNRASAFTHLAPGHGVLRQGEYLRGCGGQQQWPIIGGWGGVLWCEDPHVLHLEAGGNLVLYKGHSPCNHAGPVWTSGALTSYRMGLGGRNNGNGKGGGKFHALVSVNGVLKVVRVDEGKKRKEAMVFSRPVSRLPAGLLGIGVVKGK